MRSNVASTPLFLRVSAVAFAAAMLAAFVWYSQGRAQTPTRATMMESGATVEASYRRWNPLLASSKVGPVAPPEWVLRRNTEPKVRLDEGQSTMAFPMLLGDKANAYIYSSDWHWDGTLRYSLGQGLQLTSTDIFSPESVFGRWMESPFEPPPLVREYVPFPDLPKFEAHRIYIEKELKPMLMSTSKSGLILPAVPVGDSKRQVENLMREALKHLFHSEPAVSAAKP